MKLGWSFFVGKHLFGIEFCSDVEALDVLLRSADGCIGGCL